MSDSIIVEYNLQQPPEQVWRALTEPTLLASWLMSNDIQPVVGHRFQFRSTPIPGEWDGTVDCEVLEVEPSRKLRYTWRTGSMDTIVSWTLTPSAMGGTRLELVHSGFTPDDRSAFHGAGEGWRSDGMSQRLRAAITRT